MIKRFLILLSFTTGLGNEIIANAQYLNPPPPGANMNFFEKYPHFSFNVIQQKKIKSITYDILTKKDYKIAEDQGLIQHYEFDKKGRLSRYYYTVVSKIIQKEVHTTTVTRKHKRIAGGVYTKNEYLHDTVSTSFFYNEKDQVILRRFKDGNYYEAVYFDYDSAGMLKRELKCKETNVSEIPGLFQLGSQIVLSQETYTYEKIGPNQIKKKCYNDEGRLFKEIIINYNENNKATSLSEAFVVAWINQVTEIKYDESGRIAEKLFRSNTAGNLELKDTFEYDVYGNLYGEKHFKNGILQNEVSYVLDRDTHLLNSLVVRDHIEKSMQITKLSYEYFSE